MYQQFEAPPSLKDFVSFLYVMEVAGDTATPLPELLMPSGTGVFGCQYAGSWNIRSSVLNGTLPPFYVVGQQTVSYTLTASPPLCGIVGAALKPTAIWHFVKKDCAGFTNTLQDPKEIWGEAFLVFREQYTLLDDLSARKNALISFLEAVSEGITFEEDIVEMALAEIFRTKGCLTTADICAKFPISERYLQIQFKKKVGLSPGAYARIIRFNNMFLEFSKHKGQHDLAFITALFNYYDAAHFNKDFKKFCGEAPSSFQLENFHLLMDLIRNGPYLTKVSD